MSDPKEMFEAAAMDSYIEAMESLEEEVKILKLKVCRLEAALKKKSAFHDVEEFYSDDTNSQGIDK